MDSRGFPCQAERAPQREEPKPLPPNAQPCLLCIKVHARNVVEFGAAPHLHWVTDWGPYGRDSSRRLWPSGLRHFAQDGNRSTVCCFSVSQVRSVVALANGCLSTDAECRGMRPASAVGHEMAMC